jgi:ribosomal protein S18 acetylase RimI-like enzyme
MTPPQIEIQEEPISQLAEHARIPNAFEVDRVLDVVPDGRNGIRMLERPLSAPFMKDYDAITGNHPTDWKRLFDLTNWVLLSARFEQRRVGGAVVAIRTPGMQMLEGCHDRAVLWDLRVAPEMRRRGIASALFTAAERWAADRGCRQLKIETQNINVAACRFYASQGCELGGVQRFAYPQFPEEVQLIWPKNLS